MNTKTFIVHFISGITGLSMYVGEYKTREGIRKAQDRYSLKYGAHLGVKIIEKDTMNQVQIYDVPKAA